MVGPPNFFSSTTLRPLGPSVTLTAFARWLTPRRIAWRASSPYTICFAAMFIISVTLLPFPVAAQNAEDLVLTHDQVLVAIQLDVVARVLAKQDAIADLHVESQHLAVFRALAIADGDHLALLRLFFRRVGDVETTLHGLAFFDPFNHDAVVKRPNVHNENLRCIPELKLFGEILCPSDSDRPPVVLAHLSRE